MNTQKNRFGEALVTNTMLVEASKFLDHPHKDLGNRIGAFFDFCSVIEAVILHKRINTLEGEIVEAPLGSNYGFISFPLIEFLTDEKILKLNEISVNERVIKQEMSAILGGLSSFDRCHPDDKETSIADMLPKIYSKNTNEIEMMNNPDINRRMFLIVAEHWNPEIRNVLIKPSNAFEFFQSEAFSQFIRGTGNWQRGAYVLRTFLYNRSAWNERITFIPDYPRIPFLSSTLDHYYQSVIYSAYHLFAEELGYAVNDFIEDLRPIGIPLPPFTSILLKRCKTADDFYIKLIEMREEFTDLRENLSIFEENRLSCTDIDERNKERENLKAIFSAASRNFKHKESTTFNEIINFGGDLMTPIYDPMNPLAYRTHLLTQPIEWIRNWFLKRPLAQFSDVAFEIGAIKEYEHLCRKVFKIEFSEMEIEKFKTAQATLNQMFKAQHG